MHFLFRLIQTDNLAVLFHCITDGIGSTAGGPIQITDTIGAFVHHPPVAALHTAVIIMIRYIYHRIRHCKDFFIFLPGRRIPGTCLFFARQKQAQLYLRVLCPAGNDCSLCKCIKTHGTAATKSCDPQPYHIQHCLMQLLRQPFHMFFGYSSMSGKTTGLFFHLSTPYQTSILYQPLLCKKKIGR